MELLNAEQSYSRRYKKPISGETGIIRSETIQRDLGVKGEREKETDHTWWQVFLNEDCRVSEMTTV